MTEGLGNIEAASKLSDDIDWSEQRTAATRQGITEFLFSMMRRSLCLASLQ